MEAPGSVPGVGTEVHDRGYDRDEPVILVEAGGVGGGGGGGGGGWGGGGGGGGGGGCVF